VLSEPRTPAASKFDSAKTPVKTRAVDSDGDSARKHASMSYDKGIIDTNLHHLYRMLICLTKNSVGMYYRAGCFFLIIQINRKNGREK
jgi:hypothetical protein